MQLKIGNTYEMDIAGLSHQGAGVGRLTGLAVFVEGALPGERVEVQLTVLKSKFAKAKLLRVLAPVVGRVEPVCPSYASCGGCQLQHLDYQEQLKQKTQRVKDALTRIGKLEGFELRPTLGMLEPWYYRNKAQLHVGLIEGRVRLGYYSPGTHQLVPVGECALLPQEFTAIIEGLEKLFTERELSPYNRKTGQGTLKHLILKKSMATGEIMAVIVTATSKFPGSTELGPEIARAFSKIVSVVQNISTNDKHILGPRFRLLAGADRIKERLRELDFLISAPAFFQVNPLQTEVLYNKALEYADLHGEETIIDLYCGTGAISLFLAHKAKYVYGVEEVEMAVVDARRNAKLNGITNVEFRSGTVEEVLPAFAQQGIQPDVIVLDPPRQGCDPRALEALAALNPQRIVYVSCDPSTLARDLRILQGLGYETKKVQPVDMFPQTVHVECIIMMTNSGLKSK